MKSRKIVLSEGDVERLQTALQMTEQKFFSNVSLFISQLLQDPVNTQPTEVLIQNGLDRKTLINELINADILKKKTKISDKDDEGNFKTPTMRIKFICAKKDYNFKLKKLYIKLFEKDDVEDVMEDGCCGATSASSSGAFVAPFGSVQRRNVEETTTTSNVGNYTYTAPAFGDKQSLMRRNGKFGSVSVNIKK